MSKEAALTLRENLWAETDTEVLRAIGEIGPGTVQFGEVMQRLGIQSLATGNLDEAEHLARSARFLREQGLIEGTVMMNGDIWDVRLTGDGFERFFVLSDRDWDTPRAAIAQWLAENLGQADTSVRMTYIAEVLGIEVSITETIITAWATRDLLQYCPFMGGDGQVSSLTETLRRLGDKVSV